MKMLCEIIDYWIKDENSDYEKYKKMAERMEPDQFAQIRAILYSIADQELQHAKLLESIKKQYCK